MSNLGPLVPRPPAPPSDVWRWATVTANAPLRVRLDGEATELDVTPSTIAPTAPPVGTRVWCQMHRAGDGSARQLVIHAATGGAGGAVGDVVYSAAPTRPNSVLADGAEVSRAQYADLFAVIGETYGAGDGSTTFNLPNLSGRMPVGVDPNDADFTAGKAGGEKTHTLTAAQLPAHSHGVNLTTSSDTHSHGSRTAGHSLLSLGSPSNDDHGNLSGSGRLSASSTTNESSHHTTTADDTHNHTVKGSTANAGSGNPFGNMPPYVALYAHVIYLA